MDIVTILISLYRKMMVIFMAQKLRLSRMILVSSKSKSRKKSNKIKLYNILK
jgi:hypothetical protein